MPSFASSLTVHPWIDGMISDVSTAWYTSLKRYHRSARIAIVGSCWPLTSKTEVSCLPSGPTPHMRSRHSCAVPPASWQADSYCSVRWLRKGMLKWVMSRLTSSRLSISGGSEPGGSSMITRPAAPPAICSAVEPWKCG
eukprot:2112217-Pleurochrysis_carterae.AAC.1